MRRFLDSEDQDDPMLSVVNVIDVFLVIVVMLLIMVARNSATMLNNNDSSSNSAGTTVPDEATALERYETSGEIGEGSGVKAGTTYRLDDGTLILVTDE